METSCGVCGGLEGGENGRREEGGEEGRGGEGRRREGEGEVKGERGGRGPPFLLPSPPSPRGSVFYVLFFFFFFLLSFFFGEEGEGRGKRRTGERGLSLEREREGWWCGSHVDKHEKMFACGGMIQCVLLRANFFVTSSTLLSSDQPMSYNPFCTHPPSTTNFLITLRCGVCPRLFGLSSQHILDLAPATLPFATPHSRVSLTISSNRPSWLASEASSSRPAGRPLSCPPLPAPSNSKVCHCGHLI